MENNEAIPLLTKIKRAIDSNINNNEYTKKIKCRNNIIIKETKTQRFLWINDSLQGIMDLKDNTKIPDNFKFMELFEAAYDLNPKIKKVLVIGLGAGIFPRRIHKLRNAKVDIVEIDKEIVTIAKKYFHIKASKHFKIHIGDGRKFLEKTKKKYDLIVVDAFDQHNIPLHLFTKEFLILAKYHLNKNGVLLSHIASTLKSSFFFSLTKTAKTIFKKNRILTYPRNNSKNIPVHILIFSTDNKNKFSKKRTLKSIKAEPLYISNAKILEDKKIKKKPYFDIRKEFS